MPGFSDRELLDRLRAESDPAAAEALFLRHADAVYGLCLRILGEEHLAEDAAQEAYLRLLGAAGRFEPGREARPWLLGVAANAALDLLRSERRRARRERARVEAAATRSDERPDARAESAELARAAALAVDALETDLRVPVLLCCAEGLRHEDVARALGLSRRAVGLRVEKGLEKLRRRLAGAGLAIAPAALASALARAPGANAPASLVASVPRLTAAGSKTAAAGASVLLRGGIAMKLVAGIALAGAAVAGAALVGGGGGSPLGAAAPPAERTDPPENRKYAMRLLVQGYWIANCGALDGPAGQAEATDLIKGHDVDDAGNLYWTECDSPVIRCYRPETDRVVTLAGGPRGLSDGPIERARFGGWSYNSTNLISVSGDGKHLFVRDVGGKGLWRYVDLENGTVTTLGQWHHYKGGYYVIVRDKSGEIYAFCTSGADVPDCRGYKKLKVAPSADMSGRWISFDRFALDAERMRFYWHCRGPTMMTDLKTGKVSCLTAPGREARPKNTSGPLETTVYLCPTGMAISPAGRYLYVGQGDGSSCFRLDFEKKYAHVFGGLDGGGFGWRETVKGDRSCHMTGSTGWPAATVFIPDGRGYWATCWGLYGLTPMKGGR